MAIMMMLLFRTVSLSSAHKRTMTLILNHPHKSGKQSNRWAKRIRPSSFDSGLIDNALLRHEIR